MLHELLLLPLIGSARCAPAARAAMPPPRRAA
jgi:hypothetical protein